MLHSIPRAGRARGGGSPSRMRSNAPRCARHARRGLFAGGELSEEDRDGVMQAMMDIYWKTKQENKKYTPKKYRKPTE